jgi:hypothetical protein
MPLIVRVLHANQTVACRRSSKTSDAWRQAVADSIEEGDLVFVADGEDGIGSVRRLLPEENALLVYIENGGDFVIPARGVRSVHDGKVVLDLDHLPSPVLEAIGNARRSEYPH